MHIDNTIQGFMGVLHFDPVHHGAQIIAEMQIARGLHAGENAGRECGHRNNPSNRGLLIAASLGI
jgi:hypothetical protein